MGSYECVEKDEYGGPAMMKCSICHKVEYAVRRPGNFVCGACYGGIRSARTIAEERVSRSVSKGGSRRKSAGDADDKAEDI